MPQIKARMVSAGARKKTARSGGITPGGTTEQTLTTLCDIGKDLSIAALRGAQVTINLEEDFQNHDKSTAVKKPIIPMFVRSTQVS